MKVLFLSVSTGGGHIKAAKAVRDIIVSKYPDSECLIVDTLKQISPFVDKLIVGTYLSLVRNIPLLYGNLYKLSESSKGVSNITNAFSKLLAKYIVSLIKDFDPSLIVCTHTFPLQMVSYLKGKNIISVPIAAIVTDYVNHPFWNLPNIDALIVPGQHVKNDMIRTGMPENIIYPLGIPLLEDFIIKNNKNEIRKALRLDNKLTALIMGGSLGIRSVYNSFKLLMNSKRDMQILILTGENKKLKKEIEQELQNYHIKQQKTVRVFGYINNVSQMMDAADFIITKAGGLTISEALVKELPIFLISSIPGQEERNASFLVNSGAAVSITLEDSIDDILNQTIYNPEKLKLMKQKARLLARPYAAYDTMELFEALGGY